MKTVIIFCNFHKMAEVSEGNFFSEKALLPIINASHSNTVIAKEPTRLLKLSRSNFLEIIKSFPSSYATIVDILTKRAVYLIKGTKLISRLNLGDYYYKSRRFTDRDD